MFSKKLLMAGFEPESSNLGSDRSANCARTTAQGRVVFGAMYHIDKSY